MCATSGRVTRFGACSERSFRRLEGSFQEADWVQARQRGACPCGADLQGASLDNANLQGASLQKAQLQGTSFDTAQLQGASLDKAQLQGASLDKAQLQGASLDKAQLQGASLDKAQLQGASLERAALEATDLSNAFLWRTNRAMPARSVVKTIRFPNAAETWKPSWEDKLGKILALEQYGLPSLAPDNGISPRERSAR